MFDFGFEGFGIQIVDNSPALRLELTPLVAAKSCDLWLKGYCCVCIQQQAAAGVSGVEMGKILICLRWRLCGITADFKIVAIMG